MIGQAIRTLLAGAVLLVVLAMSGLAQPPRLPVAVLALTR